MIEYKRIARPNNTVSRNRFYFPQRFTKEQWLALLRKSKPDKQQDYLTRTNYQSLGMSPAEFLEVLYEVESDIWKEPALKQERQG